MAHTEEVYLGKKEYQVLGQRPVRHDGADKVTGKAIYTADIQLPNMSGVDCVAHLKELLPSVKAIMVTVYEDPDRIFRALRAGASGYLLKRSTPEEVLNAYRALASRKANMELHIFPGVQHGYMMHGIAKAFDSQARAFSMTRAVTLMDRLRSKDLQQPLREGLVNAAARAGFST